LFNTVDTLNIYGFYKNIFIIAIDKKYFLFFVSKNHLVTIVGKPNDVDHLVTIWTTFKIRNDL